MKNWKIIVLLLTSFSLSACLEGQSADKFRLSYRSGAAGDTLFISFDAKEQFDAWASPAVNYNETKLTTVDGRTVFARSLSSVHFENDPDGMMSGGLNPSCSLTANNKQTVTCALHFPQNSFPWPHQSAIKLVFPVSVVIGQEAQDKEIITPALDFSEAVRQPYYNVANRGLADLANIRLNADALDSIDAGFVAPAVEPEPEAPAAPLDTDGDGIADELDNCPTEANESQSDLDEDLIGDTCDPATNLPDENFLRNEHGDEDYEGDGVLNSTDNCIYTSNEDQADLDNNGVGSICDDTEPVVEGCHDNLNKNSIGVYAGAAGNCLDKDTSGANFGVFGPMSSSDGGFCALNPHSSTNLAPFAAIFVGISCLIARRRYE